MVRVLTLVITRDFRLFPIFSENCWKIVNEIVNFGFFHGGTKIKTRSMSGIEEFEMLKYCRDERIRTSDPSPPRRVL
jgi:hypothetical protein